MTNEEHALMIGLLATQFELWEAFQSILKSRGVIVNDDDVQAFLSIRTPAERTEMHEKARLVYSALAQKAGIDIGEAGKAR